MYGAAASGGVFTTKNPQRVLKLLYSRVLIPPDEPSHNQEPAEGTETIGEVGSMSRAPQPRTRREGTGNGLVQLDALAGGGSSQIRQEPAEVLNWDEQRAHRGAIRPSQPRTRRGYQKLGLGFDLGRRAFLFSQPRTRERVLKQHLGANAKPRSFFLHNQEPAEGTENRVSTTSPKRHAPSHNQEPAEGTETTASTSFQSKPRLHTTKNPQRVLKLRL